MSMRQEGDQWTLDSLDIPSSPPPVLPYPPLHHLLPLKVMVNGKYREERALRWSGGEGRHVEFSTVMDIPIRQPIYKALFVLQN